MVSFATPTAAMPPPPTPIMKRPTLGMKRDSSFLDTDDEHGLSSSFKKQRVSFNDHIDVKVMPDWNDESYDLVKEKVRLGIQRHLALADERDDTQYARLLNLLGQEAFSADAPSTKLLHKYVMALNSRMPALGDCGKLVMAILDISWMGREEEFVDVYINFLVILASTHGKFVSPIMDRLVAHFERLPASTGRLPGEDPVSRVIMFDRIHTAIQLITNEVPSAGGSLLRMLKHQFPNDMSTTKGHLQYQRHLLRVAEEVPHLKSEIIALIVQRQVDVDVQIQQDLDDLEDDEEEEKLLQRQPSQEGDPEDSDDSDLDSVSESEMTTTEEEQRLRDLRLKVAKMDATQNLLFEHYEPAFRDEQLPHENEAYQELLSHFTTFIMPNRCRHAQFLLFHFSQVSPRYANDFLQHLLRLTLDRTAATPTRLTACAYVASFAARASHVPSQSVRTVFVLLCQFLDTMRRQYEPNCVGPDRKSFSMYYAVAQALLYIFCFKWRDLVVGASTPGTDHGNMSEEDILAEGNDLKWIADIKEILTTNVQSTLNPLKVCSAAIVTEFAKIANHLRFLYVFSLLERNKRIRLGQAPSMFRFGGSVDIGRRETAWDRKTGDAHHQLEAYFPFDPYNLPQSKRWLEGEYNEWKLPRGMKREDEDDEASESEDEYESDDESIPEDLTAQPDCISISS